MSLDKLQYRFLCSDHFRKEDFLSRKLTITAVPKKFDDQSNFQGSSVRKVYPGSTTSKEYNIIISTKEQGSDCNMFMTAGINVPTFVSKNKSENHLCEQGEIKKDNILIKVSSCKVRKKSIKMIVPRQLKSLRPFARTLTRMQLYHRSKSSWQPDEKSMALILYNKSPSTYKFLMSKGCILPPLPLLKLWQQRYK